MHCGECGKPISDGDKFCAYCGAPTPGADADGFNPMALFERLIDWLIGSVRSALDVEFFESNEAWLERQAKFATPAAAIAGLVLAIVVAIKIDSLRISLMGVAWVIVVFFAYYVGRRFLDTDRQAVRNSPSTISSAGFLDVMGLLLIGLLGAIVVVGIYMAIKASSLTIAFYALGLAIAVMYFLAMVLNPQLISLTVDANSTPGQDAISIFIVFSKCLVRLAGVTFGSGVIIGTLQMLPGIFTILAGKQDDSLEYMVSGIVDLLQMAGGIYTILYGLLYPFFIYLSFVFTYLIVEVVKAILSLNRPQTR